MRLYYCIWSFLLIFCIEIEVMRWSCSHFWVYNYRQTFSHSIIHTIILRNTNSRISSWRNGCVVEKIYTIRHFCSYCSPSLHSVSLPSSSSPPLVGLCLLWGQSLSPASHSSLPAFGFCSLSYHLFSLHTLFSRCFHVPTGFPSPKQPSFDPSSLLTWFSFSPWRPAACTFSFLLCFPLCCLVSSGKCSFRPPVTPSSVVWPSLRSRGSSLSSLPWWHSCPLLL